MAPEDNGGRRSGEDRRKSIKPIDFKDRRRTRRDRRVSEDRRCGVDRRSQNGFRHLAGMDRRRAYRNTRYLEMIYNLEEPSSN